MMFIDDDPRAMADQAAEPAEIAMRDLLMACAAEAGRQAEMAGRLDQALGALLGLMHGHITAGAAGATTGSAARASDLQQADLMRPEMAGLANVLRLLAQRPSFETTISAAMLGGCTPLADLRRRLLSPAAGG